MEIPRTNALGISHLVAVFENHKGRYLSDVFSHHRYKCAFTYHPHISLEDDVVYFIDIDAVEIYPNTLERF